MKMAETRLRFRVREGVVPRPSAIPVRGKAAIATAIGLAGVLGLALPVVVYGWVSDAHAALELPAAATAWVFGLTHFAQNGYDWSSIVIGALLLAGYGIVHGIVFGGVADRFVSLRTLPETVGAGLAWGFVSWLFAWYTLLPIARDGAPFRETATSALSVAPVWVFVVGFAVLGIATSLTHRALRRTT